MTMPKFVGNDPNNVISGRFDKTDYHLYADGQQLPLITRIYQVWILRFPYPTFDVSPEAHNYRLVVDTPAAWDSMDYPKRVTSEFEFTSQRPDPGTQFDLCLVSLWTYTDNRCDPLGILGLRFDAHADHNNTEPAGKTRTLSVIGYHPDDDDAVDLRSVSVKVSFDDGDNWRNLRVHRQGDGTVTARVRPPKRGTTGAVSFKVTATDADGRKARQTVMRGYGIS
jgi:hypothetical protein